MRELIERYVRELVKSPALPIQRQKKAAQTILQRSWQSSLTLRSIRSRQENISCRKTALAGLYHGDMVKGRNGSRKTIILTGHYDVVDTEEYGNERALAYDVEKWEDLVKSGMLCLVCQRK